MAILKLKNSIYFLDTVPKFTTKLGPFLLHQMKLNVGSTIKIAQTTGSMLGYVIICAKTSTLPPPTNDCIFNRYFMILHFVSPRPFDVCRL